ncbi:FkbM family methyltransferase [Roseomonas sp. KE2513]|uniref:FkbM family methyltransferase n=1 Tax=Roseomonas sp. KE2513 TaxID=2479202 RepID=UPI0018DF1FB5|nr:FkbM family methyltransferase [Roseomonas sp. KE2513]MBI0534446.1 FkbM family methyltransferase [Roseomonas sp. KE2513]
MPFVSYAQNFEDVLLWRALRNEPPGFYVDVGAADPEDDSVTRAFYDRGWHGLNIEPLPEFAERLRQARPRDTNLQLAAGEREEVTTFYAAPGTGLSTMRGDLTAAIAAQGFAIERMEVPVRPLSALLAEHAPTVIHFIKIDAEGAERAVLAGCDFDLFRPWIVLVEATRPMSTRPSHEEWEPILLEARYAHVFFDGLNRYYVAREKLAELAPHFTTPANVFDDFVRAADRGVAGERAGVAARAAVAEASARAAYAQALDVARETAALREAAALREREQEEAIRLRDGQLAAMSAHNDAMDAHIRGLTESLAAMEREAVAQRRIVRRGLSWVLRGSIRVARRALRPAPGPALALQPAEPALPAPEAPPTELRAEVVESPVVPSRRAPRPLTAVHQVHASSAIDDGALDAMLMLRRLLRGMGYRSEIFVEKRPERLKGELRLLEELPLHADHVLIVRHAGGDEEFGHVLASAAPKVLLSHSITPPAFLTGGPAAAARLGRGQLVALRPQVVAALAEGEFHANELRALGYSPVRACALHFDLEALRREAAAQRHTGGARPFTVIFTGRVSASKGQRELIEAYARFRALMDRPCQLVLVGRTDLAGAPLFRALDDALREGGLEEEVVITGRIPREELHARLAEADLFVSLSQYDGFGLPLVEAILHGLPVLAWPGGAIPYILGGAGGLLESRDPERVAARMLELVRDPEARAALVAAQRAAIKRFALPLQLPALNEALAMAGAVPPLDRSAREAVRPNLRFTVTGHASGSYSLAAVNRTLALAIEAERPGHVRLRPVEGARTDDLSGIPPEELPLVGSLVQRGPAETGPEVVISQHYPVHLPEEPGDLPLAMLFWEESLLPAATIDALAAGFRAVLAPTAVVAKALVDSGLPIPVRLIGHAPDLTGMEESGRRRGRLDESPADPARVVTFLHVSSLFPRKGADVLLRAFARAFRRGDPVRLVIKGFPNPHNTMPEDLDALRAADPDGPAIELINRDLPVEEMRALFEAADAVVLPTRGEGFNLPAAEAMAAGVPLIVTGHGGQMDFCDEETARLLAWRFAPSGSHVAAPGSLWVEPDKDDLVEALRGMAADLRSPAGRAMLAERTRRARQLVMQRLRRAPLLRRLEELSLDLILAPPQPPLRVAWVTSWGVRCGVAEYTRQLVHAMPAHPDIASHVILPDRRWKAEEEPSGTPVHEARPCWTIGDSASLSALAAAIVTEDPHAVVVEHQPGLIPWEALHDLLADPAVADRVVLVALHNTQHLLEQEEPLRRRVAGVLAAAGRVLVHSVADLGRLRMLGLSDNVALLPHGMKAPLPLPPETAGPPVIGCYGFFLPGKGIGELIRALAILRRRWPELRLRLVNADYGTADSEKEIALCRLIAEEEGVADAIDWHTDFLPTAESLLLLSGCTVIALPNPASKESWSGSLSDALVAGPPVMVTPIPIFEEAGDAAFRAEGTDAAALARGLGALLSNPAERAAVQASARAWLAARSWDKVARRLQGMILGLAAARHIER